MIVATAVILALTLLLLGRLLLKLKRKCPGPDMPGPSGPLFVGSAFQVDVSRPHTTFSQWAFQYGPIYKVQMMGQYLVFLNDYHAISKAFLRSGNSFSDRPNSFCIQAINEGRRGLGFAYPDGAWSAVRKVVHRSLKTQSAGTVSSEEAMEDIDLALMEHLRGHSGEPFVPWSGLYNYALQSIFRFVLGESVEYDDERFSLVREYEELGQAVLSSPGARQLDTFPWLRWFGHKTYRDLQRLDEIANTLWESHRAGFDDSAICSVMHELAQAQRTLVDEEGNKVIDPVSVKRTMIGLFIAGISTVATSMYVMIHVLGYHPHIQERIRQEIQAQFGETKPTLAKKDQMPYCRAFILEVLRNASSTPLALPHSALRDVDFEGYRIPQGTTVLMNLWHLHHDDTFWEEPFEYRPQRYLDDSGQLVPPDHPNMRHTMPFGAGPRSCVGEVFAMPRLFLFLCRLVQQFEVKAVSGERNPCDPRSFQAGIVLHPGDCNTRLVPRN